MVRVIGLMSKEGAGQTNNGAFGVMPLGAAQEIFDRSGDLDQIDVVAAPDRTSGAGLDDLKAALEDTPGRRLHRHLPGGQGKRVVQMLDVYQMGLSFFSVIAIIVGAFLIYNTFTMTVVERTREIGMLRTVGMTSRQVMGQIMTESVILGIVGVGLGVGAGILLARGLIRAHGVPARPTGARRPGAARRPRHEHRGRDGRDPAWHPASRPCRRAASRRSRRCACAATRASSGGSSEAGRGASSCWPSPLSGFYVDRAGLPAVHRQQRRRHSHVGGGAMFMIPVDGPYLGAGPESCPAAPLRRRRAVGHPQRRAWQAANHHDGDRAHGQHRHGRTASRRWRRRSARTSRPGSMATSEETCTSTPLNRCATTWAGAWRPYRALTR